MDKQQKRKDALGLFIESVLKPAHELRQCAQPKVLQRATGMETRSVRVSKLP